MLSQLIAAFSQGKAPGAFAVSRKEVAAGLRQRVHNPSAVYQASTSLCGPSALVRTLAGDVPDRYARFVTDLFEDGVAKLGTITIQPSNLVRYQQVRAGRGSIAPADWIPLASIRDSENGFFRIISPKDNVLNRAAGITLPAELVKWFKGLGYRKVVNQARLVAGVYDEKKLVEINNYFDKRYHVLLLINANILGGPAEQTESSKTPDHWVMLTSPIKTTLDLNLPPAGSASGKLANPRGEAPLNTRANVSFTVYTWGDERWPVPSPSGNDPAKPLRLVDLLRNLYGYIAVSM